MNFSLIFLINLVVMASQNSDAMVCDPIANTNVRESARRWVDKLKENQEQNIEFFYHNLDANSVANPLSVLKSWRALAIPDAVKEYISYYLLTRALRNDLIADKGRPSPRHDAIVMTLSHKDLLSLMTFKSMALSPKALIRDFYNNFLTQVEDAIDGRINTLAQELRTFSHLKVYRLDQTSTTVPLEIFQAKMMRLSARGFSWKFDVEHVDSDQRATAGNYSFVEMVDSAGFIHHEVSFDLATLWERRALAAAQVVHIKFHLSSRWTYKGAIKENFLMGLFPGEPKPKPLEVDLLFFNDKAATKWKPPKDVEIVNRNEDIVRVKMNDASRIIMLDSDLRIKEFEF